MLKDVCEHSSLHFHGMCVECGKYLGNTREGVSLDWLEKKDNKNDVDSSSLHLVDLPSMYKEDNKFLLKAKKMRLVLDLDETLVHCVPYYREVELRHETIIKVDGDAFEEEYTIIPEKQLLLNEQYYKDIKKAIVFQLGNTAYLLFVRPNLIKFLDALNKEFDIYLYTNGTEEYAKKIVSELGVGRYISGLKARKEGEQVMLKDLQQICCSNKMTLIVDDRKDVWCLKDRANVLPIIPFKGQEDNELFFLHHFLKRIKRTFYEHIDEINLDVRDVVEKIRRDIAQEKENKLRRQSNVNNNFNCGNFNNFNFNSQPMVKDTKSCDMMVDD